MQYTYRQDASGRYRTYQWCGDHWQQIGPEHRSEWHAQRYIGRVRRGEADTACYPR